MRVRRDFRLPLKLKLSLLITSLVALAVLLVGFSLISRQKQALTKEVTKRGLTIAANLAGGAKSALATNDDLSLNILVKESMQDRDVVYVVFADEQGVVRAHPDVSAIGHPVVRPASLDPAGNQLLVQTYTRGGDEIIDISVPLLSLIHI